jgi:hypothetical protein
LGIQGRGKNGGRPELRFEEGKLQHDGLKVNMESSNFVHDESTGRITVELGKGGTMVPAAVYRALVKIALSVVDADALPSLKTTINWVRYGGHSGSPLPRVATAIVNLPPSPSAQIVVYRRKAKHPRLPHLVGEFRLGCYLYVFAVPFSAEDSWDLVGFFDDADFRETFKHYAAVEPWVHQELSSTKKFTLKPKLQFVPRNSPDGSD